MKVRDILAIFTGVGIVLFFTSHILAQKPITGWDKARFGMSVEEIKEVYKKEADFFEMYEGKDFWKETTPPDHKLIGCKSLNTSGLHLPFGMLDNIEFWFLDNKLWEIEIHLDVVEKRKIGRFILFLTNKYGDPLYKKIDISRNYYWVSKDKELRVRISRIEKYTVSISVYYTDTKFADLFKVRDHELWKKREKILGKDIKDF